MLVGRGWLPVCVVGKDRVAGIDVWLVANTAEAFGREAELFVWAATPTNGRDEDAVVAATPSTGNAWLLTLTYNACGLTEVSAVDSNADVETAAVLLFGESPLHCVGTGSPAAVSRQGRFGSAL